MAQESHVLFQVTARGLVTAVVSFAVGAFSVMGVAAAGSSGGHVYSGCLSSATKTVYAVLLAITVSVISWPYPYLPRHLTIVSVFTIGIPGFFLALAPNTRRYIPGFIVRVLRFCIPAGLVAGTAALVRLHPRRRGAGEA